MLLTSPLWTERAAAPLPPFSPPSPVLFSSGPTAPVVLTRVYANAARDDEFVEIANPTPREVDLAGWSLTDGEGTAAFPSASFLPAGGRLVVTRNSTSYAEDALATADFTFDRGTARRMEGDVLRLADDGDEVRLVDASGQLVDAYVWGDSSDAGAGWLGLPAEAMGRGELAVRTPTENGGWADSDGAGDWDGLRRHRLGQSSFPPSDFQLGGRLTAILSPDDGDGPLRSFVESAHDALDIAVYTFTSERIASSVAGLADRGVRVRVLLDGAPVGGVEPEEHRVVRGLLDAGADVRWLAGGGDVVKRYRYLHAKYAIVDRQAAWIGSENFGDAGFPSEQEDGNRGWSVVRRRWRRCSRPTSIRPDAIRSRRCRRTPPRSLRGSRSLRGPPLARRQAAAQGSWSLPTPRSTRTASWRSSPPRRIASGSKRSTSTKCGGTVRIRSSMRRSTRPAAGSPCASCWTGVGPRSATIRRGTTGSRSDSTAERGTRASISPRDSSNPADGSSDCTTRGWSSMAGRSSCRA